MVIWYIFPLFGMWHQDKSGNPLSHWNEQGCQIFLDTIYQKGGKYTKQQKKLPNVHLKRKIALKSIIGHKIYPRYPFQGPPIFTQIGIFGVKIKPSGNPGNEFESEKKIDNLIASLVGRKCRRRE
jgi:hypothetical protein